MKLDTKLSTKTQVLNVVSDENVAKLMQYESFCFDKSNGLDDGSTDPDDGEALYHLGANHAFGDALDFIETQDVSKKTAVDGRLLVVVVVVGAVVAFRGPIQRFAVDWKKAYKARRADQKANSDVVKGEVIKPDIAYTES
jgi:hypothetical protein